jgi:RimJ/RimL family protein N-acetyltransferase
MAGQRVIAGNRVRLREKKPTDARSDYRWQTDPELVQLDAVPPLTMSFSEYLLDYTAALRQPSSTRRTFAIETMDGELIGNCVYYNIDRARGETELGIMIGDRDYWDTGYGTRPHLRGNGTGANPPQDPGLEPARAALLPQVWLCSVRARGAERI